MRSTPKKSALYRFSMTSSSRLCSPRKSACGTLTYESGEYTSTRLCNEFVRQWRGWHQSGVIYGVYGMRSDDALLAPFRDHQHVVTALPELHESQDTVDRASAHQAPRRTVTREDGSRQWEIWGQKKKTSRAHLLRRWSARSVSFSVSRV